MALSAARPMPLELHRAVTTSSLPLPLSSHALPRNAMNEEFESEVSRPAPGRARSALGVNCSSRNVQCINGQITPTSPEDTFGRRADIPRLLTESATQSSMVQQDRSLNAASLPSLTGQSQSLLQTSEQCPKPLRSPIKFDLDVEVRQIDVDEDTASQTLAGEPVDQCQDETLSYHSSDWEIIKPSRRLSYGEPLELIEARSKNRPHSFRVSRLDVKWPSLDRDCSSWIDDTIKARASRPYHSEPSRKKSRLWLDLVDDEEEKIQEARATIVTHSPTKPKVIEIPRRRAVTVSSPRTPSVSKDNHLSRSPRSLCSPHTPPRSPGSFDSLHQKLSEPTDSAPFPPIGLGIESPERPPAPVNGMSPSRYSLGSKSQRQKEVFNRIRSRTTWSVTPPPSGMEYFDDEKTIKRADRSSLPTLDSRPLTPIPGLAPYSKLGETTIWILTELESALTGPGIPSLQVDSPVVQQLCLPTNQRFVPRVSSLVPPQSIYNPHKGPLSSHYPLGFSSRAPSTAQSETSSTVLCHKMLPAVCRVFPQADTTILSNLLATLLALGFVSKIHLPTNGSGSPPFSSVASEAPPFALPRDHLAPVLRTSVSQSLQQPRRVIQRRRPDSQATFCDAAVSLILPRPQGLEQQDQDTRIQPSLRTSPPPSTSRTFGMPKKLQRYRHQQHQQQHQPSHATVIHHDQHQLQPPPPQITSPSHDRNNTRWSSTSNSTTTTTSTNISDAPTVATSISSSTTIPASYSPPHSISQAATDDSLPAHIPSKARAMLGLPPPATRPPLPAFWRKAERREWAERVVEIEDGLWVEARRILGGLLVSDGGAHYSAPRMEVDAMGEDEDGVRGKRFRGFNDLDLDMEDRDDGNGQCSSQSRGVSGEMKDVLLRALMEIVTLGGT